MSIHEPSAHPGQPFAPRAIDQPVVTVAGYSDIGQVRNYNEDAYLVAALSDGGVVNKGDAETIVFTDTPTFLMVADGVGGAASGDIASLMATDTMLIDLRRQHERGMLATVADVERGMRDAIKTANRVIHTYATTNPRHHGMASTATLAVVFHQTLLLAQVGDSRAYLIRDGIARQLTKDQSLVQQLIDAGELTTLEAEQSDRKNIILQALGFEGTITPDLYHETLRFDDVLVLCSDGLSNQMHADEIAAVVQEEPEIATVCHRLIEITNQRGGYDNITVVIAKFSQHSTGENSPASANTSESQRAIDQSTLSQSVMRGSKFQELAARVRQWLR